MGDGRIDFFLEVLHSGHLRVGGFVGLGMATHLCKQFVPLLHEGMGLLFEHEADVVGHHLAVALQHVRQVHERVGDLACLVHHPCLFRFSEEMLQSLADDGSAGVEHEVGHVALIVLHHHDGLVHAAIQGLAADEHGPLGLHEHAGHMVQLDGGDVGRLPVNLPLIGKSLNGEAKEGLADRHIDMNRAALLEQGLVDQTVAVPQLFFVLRLWQRDRLLHKTPERIRLRHGLSIELPNPLLRTVGTDDDQRPMLIPGFANSRCKIEQGRATGDADHDRLLQRLRHAQGIEARRALIGHGITGNLWTLIQIVHNGRIAAARTDHGVTNAVLHKQGRENIDVFFIAIHGSLGDWSFRRLGAGASSASLLPFPAIPVRAGCP